MKAKNGLFSILIAAVIMAAAAGGVLHAALPALAAGREASADAEESESADARESSDATSVLVMGEIEEDGAAVSEYGGVYLLEYDTPEEAQEAYEYYSAHAQAAELNDFEYIIADSGQIDEDAESQVGNAIEIISDADIEEAQADDDGLLIAVIDTGASEDGVYYDAVSVIDDNPLDENGHGTNMYDAITEVNENARILSIKAFAYNGKADAASVYAGIKYAIEAGADIINLSFSADAAEENSVVEAVILEACDAGIIVVGAAGNDGEDASDKIPGGIDEVYVFGALMEVDNLRRASSNYGPTVDGYIIHGSTSLAAATASAYFSLGYTLDEMFEEEIAFETYSGVSEATNESGTYDTEETQDAVNEVLFETASESSSSDTNYMNGCSVYLYAHGTSNYYGSWSTRYKTVTYDTTYTAYCVQPPSGVPDSGTYTAYSVNQTSETNRLIKAALLIYEVPELNSIYFDSVYGTLDDGLSGSRYGMVHALISYFYNGYTTGLSSSNVSAMAAIRTNLLNLLSASDSNAKLLQAYVDAATLYKISISYHQDIMFIAWVEPEYEGYGYLDLTKVCYNSSSGMRASSCVSRSGAVFGVYPSESDAENNTNRITTITTNTDGGNADAVRIELSDDDGDGVFESSENTVYVKEITPPGFDTDSGGYSYFVNTTIYEADLTENGEDTDRSTSLITYYNTVYVGEYEYSWAAGGSSAVVPDEEIIVPFSLTKLGGGGSEISDLTGTEYKIYSGYKTDSSGNVETDENGMPVLNGTVGTISYNVSTGSFNYVNLQPGIYYIQETSAPDGYETDTSVYKIRVKVIYSSANVYYTITANAYRCTSVSGSDITWAAYGDGHVSFTGDGAQDADEYDSQATMYFTASSADDGSGEMTTTLNLYETLHGSSAAVSDLGISVAFYDSITSSFLSIQKVEGENAQEDPVANGESYSLEGAVFAVYTDSGCTTPAEDIYGNELTDLETDENGVTEECLLESSQDGETYYVKETAASAGHLLNEDVYEVTLTAGESSTVTIEEPVETIMLPSVYKKDESGQIIDLSGIQFSLEYYYTDKDEDEVLDKVLYFETDSNGLVDFSSTDYLVQSISETPYTDSDGNIVFYCGRIVITETESAEGYLASDASAEFYITVSDDGTLFYPESALEDIQMVFINTVITNICIYKYDYTTNEPAGADFIFKLAGTADDGESVSLTAVTDEDGKIDFGKIKDGEYTITETGCPDGYILDSATEYNIDITGGKVALSKSGSGINAKLEDLGGSSYAVYFYNIPYTSLPLQKYAGGGDAVSGITFRLYSVSGMYLNMAYDATVTTGTDGTAVFKNLVPGTYYLVETDTSNAAVDGEAVNLSPSEKIYKVVVSKKCVITVYEGTDDGSGNYTFEEYADSVSSANYLEISNEYVTSLPLKKTSADGGTLIQGVVFRLYSEELGYDCYEETDAYGACSFTGLVPGTYILVESSTDDSSPSAVLSDEEHTVVVSEDSQITVDGETVKTGYSYTISDDLYAELDITKRDSYSYDTVKNVVFKLTGTSEEVLDYCEVVSTDSSGYASFTGLLAGTYLLVEMDADESVLSSELDEDGNAADGASVPAVYADTTAHEVVVEEKNGVYTVTIDGEEVSGTGPTFYYTKFNEPKKGRVKVDKRWLTDDTAKLYLTSVTTLLTNKGLNVYELPIIHIASDDEDSAANE